MTHTEIEAKLELSADDYERLRQSGELIQRIDLLNVYYDAQGTLADRAITFRVRHTAGGDTEATLKVPTCQNGATRTASETSWASCRLAPRLDVEHDLPEPLHGLLGDLGVQHLDRVGWMRTLRVVVSLGKGAAVELDRVRLPGGRTIFEAEVESDDPTALRSAVQAILAVAPQATASRLSKYERFTHALSSNCVSMEQEPSSPRWKTT
ncbi:CYTH domain-containing protein [Rubrivirga litoralis]|uniref:CYTH domain-containing protein n=1 Tax=Rubrivirga litoralis TaxID=3075598 RepID=A0ABU3BQ77_9BACT|nr:CYTH domain-containing protein [Rubrivirga sp. F394]MDT0631433.1 CYTH domain-containing protein [Rubrivirga sp. F394]